MEVFARVSHKRLGDGAAAQTIAGDVFLMQFIGSLVRPLVGERGDRLVVWGSVSGSGATEGELFDFNTKQWSSAVPSMVVHRNGSLSCTLRNAATGEAEKVLILGTLTARKERVEEYDVKTNTFVVGGNSLGVPGVVTSRNTHSCIAVGSQIFLLATTDCMMWDIKTKPMAWTKLPSPHHPHDDAGVCVLDDWIYLVGGDNNAQVERFNPITHEWQTVAPLNNRRSCLAAVVLDGKIYAIGGIFGRVEDSVEVYDPEFNKWSVMKHKLTVRRCNHCAVVRDDGCIYVVGGYSGSNYIGSIEVCDPATQKWSVPADFPKMKQPRCGFAMALI